MSEPLLDNINQLAKKLRDYHAPQLCAWGDWYVAIHHDVCRIYDREGKLIAWVCESEGVICEACDPIHVDDMFRDVLARLEQ